MEETSDLQMESEPEAQLDAEGQATQARNEQDEASLQKIEELLKTKNDTSRFVGLALLKSVLDNSLELRDDGVSIVRIWKSIPSSFLRRLLRTGSAPKSEQKDAKDMLDLAVSVLHTFSTLLPDSERGGEALVSMIPLLVESLLQSSEETTNLILQTLATLISNPGGARALNRVQDLSPLTEIATTHPLSLDILSLSWLNLATSSAEDRAGLRQKIDETIRALVSTFKGTDAVTLLGFLGRLLRNLDDEVITPNPQWLKPVVDFIRSLATSKPTAAGREAYTNLTATLLQVFPEAAGPLVFATAPPPPSQPARNPAGTSEKTTTPPPPFSYLLINLILIDLRSSFPTLLAQLNSPSYKATSTRLASALDILSSFVGHLVRSLDDDDNNDNNDAPLGLSADQLLRLRRSIAETLSAAMEHLRERWDAAVAGAQGLDPSARAGGVGSHHPPLLAWDAAGPDESAARDPLVLAAVRALALWLRDDDGDALRAEAAGLTDMLIDLYSRSSPSSSSHSSSSSSSSLDFRRPVLLALESIISSSGGAGGDDDDDDGVGGGDDGAAQLLAHDGWTILSADLLSILESSSATLSAAAEADRGQDLIRVLLPLVEAAEPGPPEAWLDVVTRVAAWGVPALPQPPPPLDQEEEDRRGALLEFWVAVLQLVTALLAGAHPAVRRRYAHSTGAVIGVANQIRRYLVVDTTGLKETLDELLLDLRQLR